MKQTTAALSTLQTSFLPRVPRDPSCFHLVAVTSQQEASMITLRVKIKQGLFTSSAQKRQCTLLLFTAVVYLVYLISGLEIV